MFTLLLFGEDYWGSATPGQRHVWGATASGCPLRIHRRAVKRPIQEFWVLPHELAENHPLQFERMNAYETQAACMRRQGAFFQRNIVIKKNRLLQKLDASGFFLLRA